MEFFLKLVRNTTGFISREENNVLKTSFTMMLVIIVTKATGFLYSALVAKQLGASRETDLFLLANTIPEMLGNFIIIGLISAALMPILVKAKSEAGHDRFLKIFNSLLNLSVGVYLIIAITLAFFADSIFPFILNTLLQVKFDFSDAELDIAIRMMRILFIPQLILGISAYFSSALNVYHRFLLPQLAPLFYNLGRIIGAYFLIDAFGGAMGLVWGTVIGAVLHLIIQIPLILNLDIKHLFLFKPKDKYFKEAITLGGPRVMGLGAEYLGTGVDRFIAARFIGGSVSAYEFALRLISIPLSLFGTTFSVASFPFLAKLYQEKKYDEFNKLFVDLLSQIFFLSVPVTVVLFVLRVSLVRLFYGIFGGRFTLEQTYLTAWVVLFFAFGLVFESARSLIYRAFYAIGDTVRPLYAAVFTMVLGIVTGIWFTNYFSHFDTFSVQTLKFTTEYLFSSSTGRSAVGGLALSSSFVFTLEFFLLLFLLSRSKIHLDLKELAVRLGKNILGGVAMGIVMFICLRVWGNSDFQAYTLFLIMFVGVTSGLGMVTYLISSYFLQVKEMAIVFKFLSKFRFRHFKLTGLVEPIQQS